MNVKIKLVHQDAKIPVKAHVDDACHDVYPVSMVITDDYVEYDLGFSTEIQSGWMGLVFPRSSISEKDLLLCNPPGIIDSGYRGTWKVRFKRIWGPTLASLKEMLIANSAVIDMFEKEYIATPKWRWWQRHKMFTTIELAKKSGLMMGTLYAQLTSDEKLYQLDGKAIAQITFQKLPVVHFKEVDKELKESSRGDKGFGSSDTPGLTTSSETGEI